MALPTGLNSLGHHHHRYRKQNRSCRQDGLANGSLGNLQGQPYILGLASREPLLGKRTCNQSNRGKPVSEWLARTIQDIQWLLRLLFDEVANRPSADSVLKLP